MRYLITSIKHCTGRSSHNSKSKKQIKVINTGNEETKLSLFTTDMIVCVQNSTELKKNFFNELQAMPSEFINKSTVFLQTNKQLNKSTKKKKI